MTTRRNVMKLGAGAGIAAFLPAPAIDIAGAKEPVIERRVGIFVDHCWASYAVWESPAGVTLERLAADTCVDGIGRGTTLRAALDAVVDIAACAYDPAQAVRELS